MAMACMPFAKHMTKVKNQIGTGRSYGGSASPNSHCAKSAKMRWDKADNDAAWDGLSGYITNSKKPGGEVTGDYRRLGEIEDTFRLCKHDLKMRPIFHRKGDRIKAHLDICFITYTLWSATDVSLCQLPP